MPRVSVITPAYNAAAYLEETVESVQNQTFTDWEMLIVDDCSQDDTYSLAKKLSDKDARIRVFKNEKNIGVAASRNVALDAALGDYIAFLDSDDLWLPQKLEKQVDFMDKGQYILTYTNYQKFNSCTGEIYKKVIRAPASMTANQIYGDTSIGCLTVMVNRKKIGNFHMPLLSHMEDNITWQEILAMGHKAYRMDEVLSLYRAGNISLTSGKKHAAKQQWSTYRDYYKFSVFKSAYYFIQYAFNAVKKHYL